MINDNGVAVAAAAAAASTVVEPHITQLSKRSHKKLEDKMLIELAIYLHLAQLQDDPVCFCNARF